MVRVSPLATASWVARVPHRRAATATAPRTARRGAGARRTQPDAAAKRPDPKLLKSSSPLSATWRGLFGEGRLAGNGYRPVKPTNPVVPSGALGRTMANSGPQRRAGPQRPAAMTLRRPEGRDDVGVRSTASPTTSPDGRTSASATAPRSGRAAG